MAITTLEYDLVNNAAQACSMILTDLQPKLSGFRQIYDSEGGVQSTLTQEELDSIASFSGLTVQQVTDAMYALTTVLLPAIESGYGALSTLGARYRGLGAPLPPMPLTPAAPPA